MMVGISRCFNTKGMQNIFHGEVMGKNWTQSNFYMESLILYRIHMGIRQKMNIDAMQKYHKIQHFHKTMTSFNEHAIFRVMTLSEFNQKRKTCQNMFLSTIEFDVTQ